MCTKYCCYGRLGRRGKEMFGLLFLFLLSKIPEVSLYLSLSRGTNKEKLKLREERGG